MSSGPAVSSYSVQGTDVKLSGHFVYASVSDMSEAPPLRCTNRTKVIEWLSALGAASPADDHEVMLPELAPHHWQQLHSADPMWTKPQLDRFVLVDGISTHRVCEVSPSATASANTCYVLYRHA